MNKTNEIRLVDYFKSVLDDSPKMDSDTVETEAVKRGFIINPKGCNEMAYNYILSKEFNPNTTFYKSFKDVVSKNRWELFIDQCLHYASTYGTNYKGIVYCPNGDPISIPYDTYTIIDVITRQEMLDKVMKVCQSGIALGKDTVDCFTEFIKECHKKGYKIDLESIVNKEMMITLAYNLGMLPETTDNIIRTLNWIITGNACLIQSKRNMEQIRHKDYDTKIGKLLKNLTDKQIKDLSKSFFRYKQFWLALKGYGRKDLKSFVNKLKKMADKYHVPMKKGFWENFTNIPTSEWEPQIDKQIESLNNPFKIIRLMEMLYLRKQQNMNNLSPIYKIRNGSIYMAHDRVSYNLDWDDVENKLCIHLIKKLIAVRKAKYGNKKVLIKYPKDVVLTCPSSEKSFLGNLPFGSRYKLKDKDNYFGIYWKNEWGAHDLDLAYFDTDGVKYGWNGWYDDNENDIVFSGDMTTADPEASEMFYMKGEKIKDGVLFVNAYNTEDVCKYKLYFGQDKINDFHKNYMVNPGSIKMNIDCEMTRRQQIVGCISDNTMYVFKFDMGDDMVSVSDEEFINSMIAMCKAHMRLDTIMEDAGYLEYSDDLIKLYKERSWSKGVDYEVIDISDIQKDSIINLLSFDIPEQSEVNI